MDPAPKKGLEARPLRAFFLKTSRTTPSENFTIYLVGKQKIHLDTFLRAESLL